MVRNEQKYRQAIEFRKRGFTYTEIAKICDVSKATVANWLKNKPFSEAVTKQNTKRAATDNKKRLQLMNKARNAERKNRYAEAKRNAETEYKHYKHNPLFIAGLMLYVGEGDTKNDHHIRLSSTRPESHALFIRFGLEYMSIEKTDIHFWILLYPDLSEERCMKYWKRITTLPYSQFYKNQIIKSKSNKKTLHHGAGNTIIGSTVLKVKLNRWIELALKDLTQ